jgi:hypothetical protein
VTTIGLHRLEREAMERAERYVKVDPFYGGAAISSRERALMRLALRAFTHPDMTEAAIVEFDNCPTIE